MSRSPDSASSHRSLSRWGIVGLIGCLAGGIVLRTIWPEVMEYKADEHWLFTKCMTVGRTEPVPATGMHTSLGPDNPAQALLIWVGLARLVGAEQPTDLASAIQWLNVGALLLLAGFALWGTGPTEREPWLWATALAAVNPFTILFHRKIWQPSILPIFLVLMLMCWQRRDRATPAFFWGVLSLVVAQIHLAGLFLAAGFLLWTIIFERARMHWKAWLLGTCFGGIGLLPWLHYLLFDYIRHPVLRTKWPRYFPVQYWIHWTTEPLGLGLEYSLGRNFRDFLRWPLINGAPTYLVAIAHLALLLAGGLILVRGVIIFLRDRQSGRTVWQVLTTPALQPIYAVCFGYGGLLTLSCLGYYRHYQILSFPFFFAWLAYLALGRPERRAVLARTGRFLLLVIVPCELIVSACFWYYLHEHPLGVDGAFSKPTSKIIQR